jgi:acyl-CoA thioesterase I
LLNGRKSSEACRPVSLRELAPFLVAALLVAPGFARADPPFADACPDQNADSSFTTNLPHARTGLSEGLLRILAIGSSSTQGVGASAQRFAYPSQLEAALRRQFPSVEVEVVNAGHEGETAEATLARLGGELNRQQPDLVLWQVGTNDALNSAVSEKRFEDAVERGVDAAASTNCDIILLDQQLYKKAADPERYERFVEIIRRVAAKRRINLFSRHRLMARWEKARPGVIDALLAPDGLHMNDRGYACIASSLARRIGDAVRPAQAQ